MEVGLEIVKSMRKEGETKEGVCIEKNQEDGINIRTLYL